MLAKSKQFFVVVAIIFISYNLYLALLPVLHGEVHLTNDIGRDFLLLQELDQKKIVLIGPRTNIQGVFHGVLWTYLNYPAYVIGHGDPVVVAWFWIFLSIVYLVSSYIIFSKLFGRILALLGVIMLAVFTAQMANSLLGQVMAFYFMPAFIFTLYRYFQTKRAPYLICHLIILGFIMQSNIGVGGLVALLTAILCGWFILKNKLAKHSLAFFILPASLVNFLLFEVKYHFSMTKGLVGLGRSSSFIIPFDQWIVNRIENITSLQLLPYLNQSKVVFIFLIVMIISFSELKKKKRNTLLSIIVFFYFSYFFLTYFNKGIILLDHIILLTPVAVMWLLTLAKGTHKTLSIALIVVIIGANFFVVNNKILSDVHTGLGKSQDSWLSLKQVAKHIVDMQNGKEFGYYVYSPDAFAYQQRYAMTYYFHNAHAKAGEYVKKSTTYVIVSAPPNDNPYMTHEWWIKNKANISKKPTEKKIFENGYMIEKYVLSDHEQKIPHNPNIELGIHFR